MGFYCECSPVFGRPVNYTAELGGEIVRNEKGEIVKAQAIIILWSIATNKTAISSGQAVRDDGTGELADEVSLKWEAEWMKLMEEIQGTLGKDSQVQLHYGTGKRSAFYIENSRKFENKI